MLAKLRSLISAAKNKTRPYKLAKSSFLQKRGRFERLEDRRMLSAGTFKRVALDSNPDNDLSVSGSFYAEADGGPFGSEEIFDFPPGPLPLIVESATRAQLLAVPIDVTVAGSENGIASIIADNIYTEIGSNGVVTPINSTTPTPTSVSRIGDMTPIGNIGGITTSATGIQRDDTSNAEASADIGITSHAAFEYVDDDASSLDIFNGLVEFVTKGFGTSSNSGAGYNHAYAQRIRVYLDIGPVSETLVDLTLTVGYLHDMGAGPFVTKDLDGTIVGYEEFDNTPVEGARLALPFEVNIPDGSVLRYYTTILPFSQFSYAATFGLTVSSSGSTITEANIFGSVTEGGSCDPGSHFTILESEPNNGGLFESNAVPLGFETGEYSIVNVEGTISTLSDVDFFQIDLMAGDILGAALCNDLVALAPDTLSLWNGLAALPITQIVSSSQDLTYLYPEASPLPGGKAALSYVIDTNGTYFMEVEGSNTGDYKMQLQVYRPVLEEQLVGNNQILLLDFDGADVDLTDFGSMGTSSLEGLSEWFDNWNIGGNVNQLMDEIVNVVEAKLVTDLVANGMNPNFSLEIFDSRDDVNFGEKNVSRVVVGGSVAQFGIPTIGLASSIDVGNFDTEETAVVLLDKLSASTGDFSLNSITLGGGKTKLQLVAEGIGNVIAHEAGHFFANFHTDGFDMTPNLMDEGPGGLPNLLGITSGTTWTGQSNYFGSNTYSDDEGFTGSENTRNAIAFALMAGQVVAPTITDVVLSGSAWSRNPIVMSARVDAGEQLRAIPIEGIDTIEIHFSEEVRRAGTLDPLDGSELELTATIWDQSHLTDKTLRPLTLTSADFSFNYDFFSNVATWTLLSGMTLGNGKYAIHFGDELTNPITDLDGNKLNAEWENPTNGTSDDYTDDDLDAAFESLSDSGDDTAGITDTDGDGKLDFRFHFAVLAGDYNGNNFVDAFDFFLWQQEYGKTDELDNPADGNGDGNVNDADYDIWENYWAEPLPLKGSSATISHDINDDEKIDLVDSIALLKLYDDIAIPQGLYYATLDIDADGDLEADDRQAIFDFRTTNFESVWYKSTASVANLSGVAPFAQVANVIVSGSNSPHNPFSFDTVDGSGQQLATVPVGAADTISIVFSEDVFVSASHLQLIGLSTAIHPNLVTFSYDATTLTASWQFDGWALGDQYLIELSDFITDFAGNALDGEWTNPASITTTNVAVSEFPSGDGTPGGSFNFILTLLPGDANLDGTVDAVDASILFASWGVSGGAMFEDGDANGDGLVNAIDFGLQSGNWGVNLQDVWVLTDLDSNYEVDVLDLNIIIANMDMTGATWADGDLDGDGIVTIADLILGNIQVGLEFEVVA